MFTLHEFREAMQNVGVANIDIDTQQAIQALAVLLGRYEKEYRDEGRLGTLVEIQNVSKAYVRKMEQIGRKPGQLVVIMDLFRQSKEKMGTIKAKQRWAKVRQAFLGQKPKRAKAFANLANLARMQQMQQAAKMATGPKVNVQGQPVKSKKLLDDYWREVFDPRHRAARTTQEHYKKWMARVDPASPDYDESYRESFFDYLDKVDTENERLTVRYMDNEAARRVFEVTAKGASIYNASGYGPDRAFSTEGLRINDAVKNNRGWQNWGNWVLGTDKRIFSGSAYQMRVRADGSQWYVYVHHSSYYNGGAILCGGEWVVIGGQLKYINCQSGHYHPSFAQFVASLQHLRAAGVDVKPVLVEWYIGDVNTSYFYKAEDFLKPGAKGQWFEQPTFVGRPLRRVNPLTKAYIDPDADVEAAEARGRAVRGGKHYHDYRQGPPADGGQGAGGVNVRQGYANQPGPPAGPPEGYADPNVVLGQGGGSKEGYGDPNAVLGQGDAGYHGYQQPPQGPAGRRRASAQAAPAADPSQPPHGYDFRV